MNQNLIKEIKLTIGLNPVAAGQTDQTSTIIDMAGWDGVLVVALFGAVTDAAAIGLKLQGNTLNQTGGMADIPGATSQVASALTNSNQAIWVDVYRPVKEFIQAVVHRATQNAVIDNVLFIQYNSRTKPTVQDVTTILQGALATGV